MEAIDKLSAYLKTRLVDLNKAKEEGDNIIGYTAGSYLPEELVSTSNTLAKEVKG